MSSKNSNTTNIDIFPLIQLYTEMEADDGPTGPTGPTGPQRSNDPVGPLLHYICLSNGGNYIINDSYYGQGSVSSSYGDIEVLIPFTGIITAIYSTKDSSDTIAGNATLYINNVATSLSVSFGVGSGQNGSSEGPVNVKAFDRVSIRCEGYVGSWSYGATTLVLES